MADDIKYLRRICLETYLDMTSDPDGLAACERLESVGLVRIAWDGPAWRVFQSSDQVRLSIATLAVVLNS